MYPGPLVRTYSNYTQYERDAANMAQFGFYATSVQKDRVTDGCVLTALLIIGLLLTPVCIGFLILLFIPTAFSTRVTVYYSQPLRPPAYSVYLGVPPRPPTYPAPVTIPFSHSNVYPPAYGSPQRHRLLEKFTEEFTVQWRDLMADFRELSFVRQVLCVMGILAGVSAVFVVSLLIGQAIFRQ